MIEITEIIRPLEQGITQPYLCVGDDDKRYAVKGQSATKRGLVAEFVCAKLAERFGLPIPPHRIAYVAFQLVKYDRDMASVLGFGELFASEFIDGIGEVTLDIVQRKGMELAAQLYLFDYWIRNGDRSLREGGGNPNLFYRASDESFWVLDHNLAFEENFNFVEFSESHLGQASWHKDFRLIGRGLWEPLMEQCYQSLDEIFAELPEEWDVGDGIKNYIRLTLARYTDDNFWEQIQ